MTGLDDNAPPQDEPLPLPPPPDEHEPNPRWGVVLQDVRRDELEDVLVRVLSAEKFAHVPEPIRAQAHKDACEVASHVPGDTDLFVRIASNDAGDDYSIEVGPQVEAAVHNKGAGHDG